MAASASRTLVPSVSRGQRVLEREGPRVYARAHHHGHEARALLVGPHAHLQRRARAQARIVERVQHLQARQHAVVAVETPARGLGVDVAAGGHRRQRVVGARAARKEVADRVHPQRAAELARPGHELLAALAVELGQRQAAHAAARRGTDARQRHEALPQALGVHVQRRGEGSGGGGSGGCGGAFDDSVHGSRRAAPGSWGLGGAL
jgi:hypothetical protein